MGASRGIRRNRRLQYSKRRTHIIDVRLKINIPNADRTVNLCQKRRKEGMGRFSAQSRPRGINDILLYEGCLGTPNAAVNPPIEAFAHNEYDEGAHSIDTFSLLQAIDRWFCRDSTSPFVSAL